MEAPSANICDDGHGSDLYSSLYREQGLPLSRGLHLRICNGGPNLLLVRRKKLSENRRTEPASMMAFF